MILELCFNCGDGKRSFSKASLFCSRCGGKLRKIEVHLDGLNKEAVVLGAPTDA